jgi:hypothetical protein
MNNLLLIYFLYLHTYSKLHESFVPILDFVTIPYQNYAESIYRMQGKMVRPLFYNAPPYSSPYNPPIQVQHGITAVLRTA